MDSDRARLIRDIWVRVRHHAMRTPAHLMASVGVNAEIERSRPKLLPFVAPYRQPSYQRPDIVTFKLEWARLPSPYGNRVWRIVAEGIEVEMGEMPWT